MSRGRWWARIALGVLLGILIGLLAGCVVSSGRSATPDQPRPVNEPGIHDLGDGRARVVGVLTTSDLEGGFTGVELQYPWDSRAGRLVVIANPDHLPGLATAKSEGWTYVAVTGRLSDNPNIQMAGPLINAEQIEQAVLPARKK